MAVNNSEGDLVAEFFGGNDMAPLEEIQQAEPEPAYVEPQPDWQDPGYYDETPQVVYSPEMDAMLIERGWDPATHAAAVQEHINERFDEAIEPLAQAELLQQQRLEAQAQQQAENATGEAQQLQEAMAWALEDNARGRIPESLADGTALALMPDAISMAGEQLRAQGYSDEQIREAALQDSAGFLNHAARQVTDFLNERAITERAKRILR
jgi:hypothetical protein